MPGFLAYVVGEWLQSQQQVSKLTSMGVANARAEPAKRWGSAQQAQYAEAVKLHREACAVCTGLLIQMPAANDPRIEEPAGVR